MPNVATFALYGVNRGDARCFKLDGFLLEIFQVGVSLLRIVLEVDLGSIGDSLEVFSFEGFLYRQILESLEEILQGFDDLSWKGHAPAVVYRISDH